MYLMANLWVVNRPKQNLRRRLKCKQTTKKSNGIIPLGCHRSFVEKKGADQRWVFHPALVALGRPIVGFSSKIIKYLNLI